MRLRAVTQVRRAKAIDADIGQRVGHRRIELGLTQPKLAALIGVSFQQLQKYENGSNRASSGVLWRLCEAQGVRSGYFFGGVLRSRNGVRPVRGSPESARNGISERETLELVKAYNEVDDSQVRKAVRDMLRSLAESGRAERARGA